MLLVIDVGNTHITLGVFEEKELKGDFPYDYRVQPYL